MIKGKNKTNLFTVCYSFFEGCLKRNFRTNMECEPFFNTS